jgi:hypothetical protein
MLNQLIRRGPRIVARSILLSRFAEHDKPASMNSSPRRVPLVVSHDIEPLKIVFHEPQLFFKESTFRQSDFRRPKLVFMPLLALK